jgi:hypothetical protein
MNQTDPNEMQLEPLQKRTAQQYYRIFVRPEPFAHLYPLSYRHGTEGEVGITAAWLLACLFARTVIF